MVARWTHAIIKVRVYYDVHILWALEERWLRWCVRWVFLGHLFNPHNAIYDLIVDVSIII